MTAHSKGLATSQHLEACREQLLTREAEIAELKAERSNPRPGWSAWSSRVPGRRRRQARSPAGVTSEVEVLRALTLPFEHREALDEKLGEELRPALERCRSSEEELSSIHKEVQSRGSGTGSPRSRPAWWPPWPRTSRVTRVCLTATATGSPSSARPASCRPAGRPMPTLPVTLQEHLDAISEEIRRIREEKESPEQRAEGTESRAGRARLGSLWCLESLSSLNLCPASSLAGSCSPSSVCSPPRRRRHSLAREGDRLGIMTPVCVCLLPASSLPEHTVFLSLFFLFSPEEHQVHLLRSEV